MARLDIEVGVRNSGRLLSDIGNVGKSIDQINDQYKKLSKSISEASFTSNQLESELNSLNASYKSGAISEATYAKESDNVRNAISSARASIANYQSQLTSLRATTLQVTSAQKEQATATKRLEGYHRSFSTGIRSTNTLSVEFSRIISDLPYGIQGVGNNIQQLAQNWAYYSQQVRESALQQGKTVTTMQLAKGAFVGLLNPVNLLTLGVAAVTAGWIAYEKYTQRAAKADEMAAKAKSTLADQTRSYISSLSSMRQAQIEASVSAEGETTRLNVLKSIIEDTSNSTKVRTSAIRALKKEFPGYFDNIKNEALLNGTAGLSYEKLTKQIIASAQARSYADKLADSSLIRQGLEDQKTSYTQIGKQAVARQKQIRDEINSYSDIEGRNARITKYASEQAELQETILNAANKVREAQSGLIPILEQEQKLLIGIEKATAGALDVPTDKGDKKKYDKQIADAKKYAEELLKLRQQIQLDTLDGYQKELQASKNKWDEELKNTRHSLEVRNELIRAASNDAIRILSKAGASGAFLVPFNQSVTGQSVRQSNTAGSSSLGSGKVVDVQLPAITKYISDTGDEFGKEMTRAVRRFSADFYKSMLNIGSLSTRTFQGVFSDITAGFTASMDDLFLNFFQKKLEETFKKSAKSLEEWQKTAVAAAGLAGTAISSLTNKTSTAGQGIGGALSGAAAGTAIAPGIGTAIGAVIGGLAGIFGANSAKKQAKLQEEQLRESEKQTKIMERTSALTYLSNIIGRATTSGIITGADVNEFGTLTARIAGQDIDFSLERSRESKRRGG